MEVTLRHLPITSRPIFFRNERSFTQHGPNRTAKPNKSLDKTRIQYRLTAGLVILISDFRLKVTT
jgi:hypothetical protein